MFLIVLQGYASQYFWEVSDLLSRLPRVVLLLLKTNDCLRAVDNALVSALLLGHLTSNSYVPYCFFFCLFILRLDKRL